MTLIHHYDSPIGPITMAADDNRDILIGLWFDGQKYDRRILKNEEWEEGILPVLDETCWWLDRYFQGEDPGPVPHLSAGSSDFQKMVYEILLSIPYGKTMTYGEIGAEIAARTGKEHMSAQAVGGAVGHNPISIIIPCHRVLGADEKLTGYAGGLDRKRFLLKTEGISWKE